MADSNNFNYYKLGKKVFDESVDKIANTLQKKNNNYVDDEENKELIKILSEKNTEAILELIKMSVPQLELDEKYKTEEDLCQSIEKLSTILVKTMSGNFNSLANMKENVQKASRKDIFPTSHKSLQQMFEEGHEIKDEKTRINIGETENEKLEIDVMTCEISKRLTLRTKKIFHQLVEEIKTMSKREFEEFVTSKNSCGKNILLDKGIVTEKWVANYTMTQIRRTAKDYLNGLGGIRIIDDNRGGDR